MTETDLQCMKNFIQINKLSDLHDGSIIFCKTDFIFKAFEHIKSIKKNVILITGNSDYCITDNIADSAPTNIKIWFCQNRLSDNPILKSIPLGLENTIECKVDGHGFVWPHAIEKPTVISESQNINPTNHIYANFNINTNPKHRSLTKNICEHTEYITWQYPVSDYSKFINDILAHKAVVCPQGNGLGDNHRIYETLYLRRVPITFNPIQYKYLHRLFPVLLLESEYDLQDHKILQTIDELFIETQKNNCFLNPDTWLNLIRKSKTLLKDYD